ncbi:MAG: hypothetical protein H6657_19540 [Ardenticatenaceae bacterium]|nr:hypothetical protein [Ardenticatenaceae bacterium]
MGRFCRTYPVCKWFVDCTAVSFVTPFWLRYNSHNLNNINTSASPKTQPRLTNGRFPNDLYDCAWTGW